MSRPTLNGMKCVKRLMKLTEKELKLNEFRIVILLAVAIFSAEFLIVSVIKVSYLNILSSMPLFILHNFGILILVISPLLLILPGFIESKVRLEKINSVLGAVRKINENINRGSDVEEMLTDACRVLWKANGYFNVTLYDGKLNKLAKSGVGIEEIPHCVQKSFSSKETVLSKLDGNCHDCTAYGKFGYCMVVPYSAQNDTITLAVFKDENFDDEEIKLLEEVVVDIGFAIDKYKADSVIRENEERYRTTFEHTGTAMMIIKEDNTLSLVNEEFVNLTGYNKEEVEDKMSWTQFIHPEDANWMKKYHLDRRNGGNPPKRYECRAIDKNGDILNIFLTVDLIPGTNKIVASLLDITHLKKLNLLLKASSDINGLVAREKSPEVVLKSVCKKLTKVYDAVFIFQSEDNIRLVESEGIGFEQAKVVIDNCPSISKAIEGYTSTQGRNDHQCNQCIDSYNYILTLSLVNKTQRGVIALLSNSRFNEDEINLLRNLTENIGFALSAYTIEHDKKEAIEQLAQNLTKFDKSADKLRNPLAVIVSSMELKNELGRDEVLAIINEQVKKIEKELEELREEENKTYELTKKLELEN